jgi:NAD+ synthase (glutamine-hydrolysing)
MMRERVQATGLPLVYAHLVGGQDEVVFEGHRLPSTPTVPGAAGGAPSFKENLFSCRSTWMRAQGRYELTATVRAGA